METILILRGWGSEIRNWDEFLKFLEGRGYKIYTPDLPGFGGNPSPTQAWSIDDYVGWVESYCEKHNLSQFFLLGHSFGGSLAVKYVLKNPSRVKKLILMDSAGIRKKTARKTISKAIAHFLNRFSFVPFYSQVRKVVYRLFFIRSDYVFAEGVMKETYLKVINEDISDQLHRISIPTLIVWGQNDKLTPLEDARLFKEKIPRSKLEIIPQVGHNLHKESPERASEIVLSFLKG